MVDGLRDYAVILLDDTGAIQFWNQAARAIFGHAAEDVLGHSAALLFPPEAEPERALAAELEQARRYGKASDNRWLIARDGHRLWAEGVVTALEDEHGQAAGFCKLVHDATERYLAAEALLSQDGITQRFVQPDL